MLRAVPKRWLILVAVMLAFTPIVIDMTILHIAVPSLTQALGATSTEILWIIDIYPLLMAGLLVPMGTLACLLYTSPSPRDKRQSRMPSSA